MEGFKTGPITKLSIAYGPVIMRFSPCLEHRILTVVEPDVAVHTVGIKNIPGTLGVKVIVPKVKFLFKVTE